MTGETGSFRPGCLRYREAGTPRGTAEALGPEAAGAAWAASFRGDFGERCVFPPPDLSEGRRRFPAAGRSPEAGLDESWRPLATASCLRPRAETWALPLDRLRLVTKTLGTWVFFYLFHTSEDVKTLLHVISLHMSGMGFAGKSTYGSQRCPGGSEPAASQAQSLAAFYAEPQSASTCPAARPAHTCGTRAALSLPAVAGNLG